MKKVFFLLFSCCTMLFAFGQDANKENEESSFSFKLPTFNELSNTITQDILTLESSLPDLSNIGKLVSEKQFLEFLDEDNIMFNHRNFANDLSLAPNLFSARYELRNNLNRIMFHGYDINQLPLRPKQ